VRVNENKWRWTGKSTKAAQLVAEDRIDDRRIAKKVGIGTATLERWKQNPEFIAKVNEIVGRLEAAILKRGIANRSRRVAILDEIAGKLLTVIEERAKEHRDNAKARKKAEQLLKARATAATVTGSDGAADDIDLCPVLPGIGAGGETGLLVRQIKLAASGATVEEFAVDTGLLKELRAHQEQAAKELGQWTEKREVTGKAEAHMPEILADEQDAQLGLQGVHSRMQDNSGNLAVVNPKRQTHRPSAARSV
jgi:hypothetical protein